ncbi:PD-(D/E)XK motif protein [Corynebacterium pyruviciproducens]|uniref:PD-(D/E)XK motif protein n=1 Tax=Corynebacterium pyruviciproducens TaxID=598660 RepID=UPI002889DD3E|nr:PD-(D/E)XK motif protein [Corynebacterium pyruviciproducens]
MHRSLEEEIRHIWGLLEQSTHEEWSVLPLEISPVRELVLLAIDTQGKRHLLVQARGRKYDVDPRGLLATRVGDHVFRYQTGEEISGRFVDISCMDRGLNEYFDWVLVSVINSLPTANDPASRAILTVNSWRRLFSRLSEARVLSFQEKAGLFGELVVLKQLLSADQDLPLGSWTGPAKQPHDFEMEQFSIEVKTVIDRSPSLEIHGLKQLEESVTKRLYLVCVYLEKSEDGLTVKEYFDQVCSIAPEQVDGLRRIGARLGLASMHDDIERFSIERIGIVRVNDDFPRITRDNLDVLSLETISRLDYDLALSKVEERLDYLAAKDLVEYLDAES